MRYRILVKLLAMCGILTATSAAASSEQLLNHDMRKLISSETVNLSDAFKGQVVLIVNTASECGFTPQFEQLQWLYDKYSDRGLVIAGFPSNDFGAQEPGDAEQIKNFCQVNYGVNFPMFAKIKVKGENAHPLYQALAKASGSPPRWNFYKYLIGRNGDYLDYFVSFTRPDSAKVIAAIEAALDQPAD